MMNNSQTATGEYMICWTACRQRR